MDAVRAILRRLRAWFVVWFVAEALIGTAAATYVLDGMSRHALLRYATGGAGTAGTILAGVVVSLILLWLAWAVLEALLDLKPWARTVMLVVGWITVASATLNLLTLPATPALRAGGVFARADWPVLMTVSVLTKAADLAFWSWAIYVLQLNAAVRAAFACRAAPPEPTPVAGEVMNVRSGLGVDAC
jgi:hypothetical protein